MDLSHRWRARRLSLVALLALAFPILGTSIAGAVAQISRFVLGGSAGTATGATISLRSTSGQPTAGTALGATAAIGSGFWHASAAAPTGVAADQELALPKVFRLHQNSPNPFNPRTSVPFDLPEPATRVTVRVYDVAGRAVATLVNSAMPAGRHSVIWTGDDDGGRAVASGIYYCVLETPNQRATSKLTLVR